MPEQEVLKLLFILNPNAGSRKHSKRKWLHSFINWETEIRAYLKNTSHQFQLYNITSDHEHESIKYWAEKLQPDRVVVVGGDGTVKLVVEAIAETGIPICIFPGGSANGMAKEIGMPQEVAGCMKILFQGKPQTIDTICINEKHLCVHLSDIGINAQLVKYFEENDMRGKWGYAKEIFRVLWRKRLMDVEIVSRQRKIIRQAFMVVLANASSYGTGARINPLSNVRDGIFEVVILRKLSLTELFKMLFYNRKFNAKKTEIFQAEAVAIKVKRRVYFQIDGEYLGKTKKITAVIKHNAVNIIFPSK